MSRVSKSKKSATAMAGGSATAAGVDYQVMAAVLEALKALRLTLGKPTAAYAITMEPRETGAEVTGWDIKAEPRRSLLEAKLNPTRSDAEQWLQRAASDARSNSSGEYVLRCGRLSGGLLTDVRRIAAIAVESAGNRERFDQLVAHEGVANCAAVLEQIGAPNPLAVLARLRVDELPATSQEEEARTHVALLADGPHGEPLLAFLRTRLLDAMKRRERVSVAQLVDGAVAAGCPIRHPDVPADGLPVSVRNCIALLQRCSSPVPPDLLLRMVPDATAVLERSNEWTEKHVLENSPKGVTIGEAGKRYRVDEPLLLADALGRLVPYLAKAEPATIREQLPNLKALARSVNATHPDRVAEVFPRLDKQLKACGDKGGVLDVALLSLDAARRGVPRTEPLAQAEAKVLICGVSWVYQRVGMLEDAKVVAEQSRVLGERIKWTRNTAYCDKCTGRLLRELAEREPDRAKRVQLLGDSARLLEQAIRHFSAAPDSDLGPSCPDVGECHSLLGRTYLVWGRLDETRDAIERAGALLLDATAKEYWDLQILRGDIDARTHNRESADRTYDGAIDALQRLHDGPSEILARALERRGINLQTMYGNAAGLKELERALALWHDLDERDAAARVQWLIESPRAGLSEAATRLVQRATPQVRMRVLGEHARRLAALGGARGRRSDPGTTYWEQLLEQAERLQAVEDVGWRSR